MATRAVYVGGKWNVGEVNVDTADDATVFASRLGFTYLECANTSTGAGETFTTAMTATRVTTGAENTFARAKRSPAPPQLPAAKPQ